MSRTLFQDLLSNLKRSNKERKLVLAKRAGYKTVEDYKKYLEGQISGVEKSTKKVTKKSIAKEDVVIVENLTDMVIAFDTTGSMSKYIISVKNHVKELIPKLFSQNPGLKISIVAFGDYCDMESGSKFGKAYQVIGLTNNENDLINFVNTAQSTSGEDSDEFYELIIQKITNETEWRDGAGKSVLLIADADPHKNGYVFRPGYPSSPDWREEAQIASNKGIIFDTLEINPGRWYKELSQITNGVCLPFKDSAKTANLMEATSLARGGEATRSAFMSKSVSAEVKEDATMDSVYAMYKTVVKK